jgi:signal transduction histidine kinase
MMFRRFWIICSVVAIALAVLSVLGLSSLGMHEKGLRAERQQEFITAARQISFDVKKKVDMFLQAEQVRPYTDYQYYYVPQASNQAAALVRSPLGDGISHGLAYGYFQLDNTGEIATPFTAPEVPVSAAAQRYLSNLKQNLLPSLGNGETLQVRRIEPAPAEQKADSRVSWDYDVSSRVRRSARSSSESIAPAVETEAQMPQEVAKEASAKGAKQVAAESPTRRGTYPISLDEQQQKTQVVAQSRANFEQNTNNEMLRQQSQQTQEPEVPLRAPQQAASRQRQSSSSAGGGQPVGMGQAESDLVQVRIEPFVPITVPEADGRQAVFAGQVFLLRHVQIENKHFVQGFRLDESELLKQITDSVGRFMGRGMGFEVSKSERIDAAYTAVLDFGFGEVVLNLLEEQPGLIRTRVVAMRNWFFGILGVVWLAVTVALAAFWRNLYEQVQLSRKKDDFISAVSHELRTPLTSIRMYTEMLEKDWVRTEQKRREYYATMRQESERLSRLIENVLDFSRIQRGRKNYHFSLGDVNACVADVVRMMRPCAERAGFELSLETGELTPFLFDRDAVVQIVINLVDNALKYANGPQDKRIIVRTNMQQAFAVIEVEDHGPGIARSQQKKIFDAFYRCGDESTRQTTGTGLGLALVKRFTEAHHGFVEIINAKPTGAIFRVALTCRLEK